MPFVIAALAEATPPSTFWKDVKSAASLLAFTESFRAASPVKLNPVNKSPVSPINLLAVEPATPKFFAKSAEALLASGPTALKTELNLFLVSSASLAALIMALLIRTAGTVIAAVIAAPAPAMPLPIFFIRSPDFAKRFIFLVAFVALLSICLNCRSSLLPTPLNRSLN